MKLTKKNIERKGDVVRVTTDWVDRQRRPAGVNITITKGMEVTNDVLMEGNVTDVDGIMNSIAQMAWERGWRPRGLMGAVARFVEVYKIPPEEK